MMASCLAPSVPTAVATFLSTLLPCGFAVGPSMSCKGRLGLWWVGRALQVGYLLGKEGDTEWVQKFETGPLPPQDLIMTPESITDSTGEEKIQPGTELLLGGEIERRSDARDRLDVQDISEGQQREYPMKFLRGLEKDVTNSQIIQERQDDQTDEEEGRTKEPYELSKIHSATLSLNRGRQEESSSVVNTAANVVSTVMISNGHTDSTDSVMAAVHTRLKLNSTDRQRTLGGPAPSVRCSSRLAAKPRQVHCLTSRIKKPPVHPLPNRHIDRQESLTEVAKSSAETVLSMGTSNSDAVAVRAANLTVDAPTCCPKVRERRYRCSSCGKKFYQISHLKKHQLSHTEAKSFTSQDCGKNHTSADNLKAHQLRHRGERPFSCPHCEKTYGLPRNLKEHMFLHTGEKPYVCEHCGKTFARRSSLRDHRLLYCSGLIYTQPPKLQCTLCPKLLANSGSLSNHMKLHTGEKPHICQHCGKSFSQKGNLNSHLRIHNGERPFPCPECDQRFAQKAELCRHRLSHTGASFLCSYCGKSLRDPHTLKSHERLHTGDRPHRCTICGKGYTMATKLRRHIKSSHVTEKPYRCHCGASYTLRQSLLRHQVQHQSQEETEEELKEALRQKAKPPMQEYAAVNSHHPKPVKGRPKKGAEDGRVQRRRRGKGEEKGSGKIVRRSETAISAGRDRKASSDTQHAVVFVHTDNTATPRYGPLLLTSLNLHSGTGQELFEVVISEGAEQCFVVQGQQTVGDLMIVQEEELCSVAQTVEINTL